MKKIISSCSVLAVLACGAALAGGPEMMPMPNCFDGFSIGIEGAFWHTSFQAYDAGRIFCKGRDCETTDDTIFLRAAAPVGATIFVAADLLGPTDFAFDSRFSDNGDGTDFTGAIGVQASYGKVFHGASFNNFYLGVTGFADIGSASDDITSKARDIGGLINFATGNSTPGAVRFFSNGSTPEFRLLEGVLESNTKVNDPASLFHASGSVRVNTHVDMDNLYGVAAKVGYLFAPNLLGYVKGGVAWSEISAETTIVAHLNLPEAAQFTGTTGTVKGTAETSLNGFESGARVDGRFGSNRDHNHRVARTSVSETEAGWLVGAGLEYCLTDHFTVNAEYNFVDFDTISAGRGKAHHLADENVSHLSVIPDEAAAEVLQGRVSASELSVLDPRQLINATEIQATDAKTDLKVSTFKVGLNYYFNFM